MRGRRLLPVLLLVGVLLPGRPAAAVAGEPQPDEREIAESVQDVGLAESIEDIALQQSIVPLQEESTSGGTVTVRISADVLFDFGEATLTPAARTRIGRIAGRLRSATGVVRVVGHTDSVGAPEANEALSRRRAEAVG
ncbi:OmpA family protein [Thermomonospora umbrina]|uniref:Outer membrane protein OmpA-like peptidoglycan-associated protein n=1 Tax=Thermomonospora umbrina TaxID=111806 RepID=A0A3D9SJW9_9ACTN|nr:OmpA family protein [Thermomonospora umbrina]REE96206.1 outer membrane protein OmpA-like peptidoglycan-associated protein [Thermomonospora umbrina]